MTEEGLQIRFLKEGLASERGSEDPFATFQMQLIGAVAQLERSMIRKRQAEGITAAKARGVHKVALSR